MSRDDSILRDENENNSDPASPHEEPRQRIIVSIAAVSDGYRSYCNWCHIV